MDLENFEALFDKACEEINSGRFYTGFALMVELYENTEYKDVILSALYDVFYSPNQAELLANFEKNKELVREYQYYFGPEVSDFSELKYVVFPVNFGVAFILDNTTGKFKEIEINSNLETKYFFRDTSREFFFEDETNEFNLHFLVDNVRDSTLVAKDNHIYLYYEDPELFYVLMQITDLTELLLTKKLVFLVSKENKALYPLDFKERFGIDYSTMQLQKISIDELKRCMYGRVVFNQAGTTFFNDVFDCHPDMITWPFTDFEEFHVMYPENFEGSTVTEVWEQYQKSDEESTLRKQIEKMVNVRIGNVSKFIQRQRIKKYFDILKSMYGEDERPTKIRWWSGLMLSYSYLNERVFTGRIVPTVTFFPHSMMFDKYEMWWAFFTELAFEYPYRRIIYPIRDVITTFCGGTKLKMNRDEHDQISDVLIRQCGYLANLFNEPANPINLFGRVIRFEDLKLNPRATLMPTIEFLNIPWSDTLLTPSINGADKGISFSTARSSKDGMDITPVYHYLTDTKYLDNDDKYRFELLTFSYLIPFGYMTKFYDGKEITGRDLLELFAKPFSFEKEIWPDSLKIDVDTMQLNISKDEFSGQAKDLALRRLMHVLPFCRHVENTRIPVDENGNRKVPIPMIRPVPELMERDLYM